MVARIPTRSEGQWHVQFCSLAPKRSGIRMCTATWNPRALVEPHTHSTAATQCMPWLPADVPSVYAEKTGSGIVCAKYMSLGPKERHTSRGEKPLPMSAPHISVRTDGVAPCMCVAVGCGPMMACARLISQVGYHAQP